MLVYAALQPLSYPRRSDPHTLMGFASSSVARELTARQVFHLVPILRLLRNAGKEVDSVLWEEARQNLHLVWVRALM